jgi:hypothetical protein
MHQMPPRRFRSAIDRWLIVIRAGSVAQSD